MLKRIGTIVAALFMGGCAGLLNSDRPKYRGPIVKPVWSVPHLAIGKAPMIHDGTVFVQPLEAALTHLYALDLHTGKQLGRPGSRRTRRKAIIGPRVMVTDDKGLLHALDSKTGAEFGEPVATTMLSATVADSILYATFQDRSVKAFSSPTQVLWTTDRPYELPVSSMLAEGTVYVYGRSKNDQGVKPGCAIHAFDAQSGTLRWKWETAECGGPEDNPMSFLAADASEAYLAIDGKAVDDHRAKPWPSMRQPES